MASRAGRHRLPLATSIAPVRQSKVGLVHQPDRPTCSTRISARHWGGRERTTDGATRESPAAGPGARGAGLLRRRDAVVAAARPDLCRRCPGRRAGDVPRDAGGGRPPVRVLPSGAGRGTAWLATAAVFGTAQGLGYAAIRSCSRTRCGAAWLVAAEPGVRRHGAGRVCCSCSIGCRTRRRSVPASGLCLAVAITAAAWRSSIASTRSASCRHLCRPCGRDAHAVRRHGGAAPPRHDDCPVGAGPAGHGRGAARARPRS